MKPANQTSVRAMRRRQQRALPNSRSGLRRLLVVAVLSSAGTGAAALVGCNETAELQRLFEVLAPGPSDRQDAGTGDSANAEDADADDSSQSSDADEAAELADAADAQETAELVAAFKEALADAQQQEEAAAQAAADDEPVLDELDAELPPEGEFVEGRLLVRFRDLPEKAVQRLLAAAGARGLSEIPAIGVKIVELPPNASEKAYLRAFRQLKEVEFAERDAIHYPDATPNDSQYSQQWHLPRIAAPTAWDHTTGSSSVIIAILDTGCLPTHPDLASKYVPGWNFYDNNANWSDVYGHGTAVAGCAAAATNNATGVAGVGWNCMLMPIRISAVNGGGSTSAMANGLVWAANQGARVANISYRVSTSTTVRTAAQYFQDHGGVVTISAGNQAEFEPAADNPYVLTVTATTSTDALASFSNTGNNVDLAAPGSSIRTTTWSGGYSNWSGTSFSAPIVAGAAALVIAANPSLSGAAVQDILKQSADDRGPTGWDTSFGWGRVNAGSAVALAMSAGGGDSGSGGGGGSVDELPPPPVTDPPPPPADTTAPSVTITFPANGATVSGQVDVTVSASDNVGVIRVELYVDDVLKKTANAAPFTNRWNTNPVSPGPHVLQCRVYDAAGNVGFSPTITVFK